MRRSFRLAMFFVLVALLLPTSRSLHGDDSHPFNMRPQPWQRRDEPVLSAATTKQDWCRVVLYSPHVVHHAGKFRMWYLGTSTASRTNDIVMGYAESSDGITWREHPHNPILTGHDVPWGTLLQTPNVLFDEAEQVFKMWFVSGRGVTRDADGSVVELDQRLGYATSKNGIDWKVHPRPLYRSGRSPSVIKEGKNKYRMWMGSSPSPEHAWDDIYKHIYEFSSVDGIEWKRSERPVIQPSGQGRSTVYPFVLKEDGKYRMWYGCHVEGGRFEIFSAASQDGTEWQIDHQRAAFAARGDKAAFDGRYTSTPCVVALPDKYLLYYSARDWKNEYIGADGKKRRDGSGVYAHIGVAVIEK